MNETDQAPIEELNEQQLVQQRIQHWLLVVVRGLTLRHPTLVRAHGHRETLYLQAEFEDPPKEEGKKPTKERVDLILHKTPNWLYNPRSEVEMSDFGGEWPPNSLIQEEIGPKILTPDSAEGKRAINAAKSELNRGK
jgi:hypothetical protein